MIESVILDVGQKIGSGMEAAISVIIIWRWAVVRLDDCMTDSISWMIGIKSKTVLFIFALSFRVSRVAYTPSRGPQALIKRGPKKGPLSLYLGWFTF